MFLSAWLLIQFTFAPQLAWSFAACDGVMKHLDFDHPAKDRCSTYRTPLERVTRLKTALDEEADLAKANTFARPRVAQTLDHSIAARTALVKCYEQTTPDTECAARRKATRTELETHMRKYRLAMALAGKQEDDSDTGLDYIEQNPRGLAFLGGHRLPPLSSADYRDLLGLRTNLIGAHNKRPTTRDDGWVFRSSDEADAYCARVPDAGICVTYRGDRTDDKRNLRAQAKEVAADTIAEFPLAAQFDHEPVTDAEIRGALAVAGKRLKDWKSAVETSSDPDELMVQYPDEMNSVLNEHPELCASVEHRFHRAPLKKYAIEAVELAAVGGVCYFSSGLACVVAGAASNVYGAYDSNNNYQNKRRRFLAGGKDGSVSAQDVLDAQKDAICNLAFSGISALPVIHHLRHMDILTPAEERRAAEAAGAHTAIREVRDNFLGNRKQDATGYLLGLEQNSGAFWAEEISNGLDALKPQAAH